jgi:hypothetical protein
MEYNRDNNVVMKVKEIIVPLAVAIVASVAIAESGPRQQITRADLTAMRRRLIDKLVREFKAKVQQVPSEEELRIFPDAENADYESLKPHRAASVCHNWPTQKHPDESGIIYWGYTSDERTADVAAAAALRACNAAKINPRSLEWSRLGVKPDDLCQCDLLLKDSNVVINPPDSAVAAATKALKRRTVPTMCTDWFQSEYAIVSLYTRGTFHECPGQFEESAKSIDVVIDHLGLGVSTDSPGVYPPAPVVRESELKAMDIRDPETGRVQDNYVAAYLPSGGDYGRTPFSLPTGWSYRFEVQRVPAAAESKVLARLRSIERSRMFGRFRVEKMVTADVPFVNSADEIAQYVRAFPVDNEEVRQAFASIEFPDDALAGLRGERSERLWAVCFIPVDKNWIPVGAPLRDVRPIALQTSAGLYLFTQRVVPNHSAGGTITAFDGAIVDASRCQEIDECLQRGEQALRSELSKVFAEPPLAATAVSQMPPHQLRFQRLYEESLVLHGFAGPFYELTTYSITTWAAPSKSVMGTPTSFFARKTNPFQGERSDHLYMQIGLALQIGIGRRSEYPEPSPQQYQDYRKAIEQSVRRAIANAAGVLGGRLIEGLIVLGD